MESQSSLYANEIIERMEYVKEILNSPAYDYYLEPNENEDFDIICCNKDDGLKKGGLCYSCDGKVMDDGDDWPATAETYSVRIPEEVAEYPVKVFRQIGDSIDVIGREHGTGLPEKLRVGDCLYGGSAFVRILTILDFDYIVEYFGYDYYSLRKEETVSFCEMSIDLEVNDEDFQLIPRENYDKALAIVKQTFKYLRDYLQKQYDYYKLNPWKN